MKIAKASGLQSKELRNFKAPAMAPTAAAMGPKDGGRLQGTPTIYLIRKGSQDHKGVKAVRLNWTLCAL